MIYDILYIIYYISYIIYHISYIIYCICAYACFTHLYIGTMMISPDINPVGSWGIAIPSHRLTRGHRTQRHLVKTPGWPIAKLQGGSLERSTIKGMSTCNIM